jgi:hypothetical protein
MSIQRSEVLGEAVTITDFGARRAREEVGTLVPDFGSGRAAPPGRVSRFE